MVETCYPLPMPPFWLAMILFGLSFFALGVSMELFVRKLFDALRKSRP